MPSRSAPAQRRPTLVAAVLIAVAAGACSKPDGAGTGAASPTPGGPATAAAPSASPGSAPGMGGAPEIPDSVRIPLDRANAAFRAARYDEALEGYRAAAAAAPDEAAPWYGVYMVAQATKDQALADSAMAAVRARARGAGMSGDTMLSRAHDGTAAPGGGLPGGHPPVGGAPPGHPPMRAPGGSGAGAPASPHQPVVPRTGSGG